MSAVADAALTEEEVGFYSDGWRLHGTLVLPTDRPGPLPGVVYSHGWSGAVNERVFPLARRIAAAGHAVLALDHRGFAGSEGPRGRCDPREQVRDVSNAVTYLSTRSEVNPEAFGVIGASFGGAIAVAAGAADQRLLATVSMVGIANGERWLRSLRPYHEWLELEARCKEDARRRAVCGTSERVDLSVLMPGKAGAALDAELAIVRAKYPDGYPLENLELARAFSPEDVVASIAPRAVCLITCADDSVVPATESAVLFELAGEPKELIVFPEGNHGGPQGPLAEQSAAVVNAFFARHLGS
jgi:alpha-beta hydrolase superfamily lysophospholipase